MLRRFATVAYRSHVFAPCRIDAPRDDEARIASHKLLLQAGYIRRLAPGVYAQLPLGERVMQKIVSIVDEELSAADCQRLTMPTLLPAQLWQQSGRWHTAGDELWRVNDRRDHKFCLGPTHEEVFATLVAEGAQHGSLHLPLRLYQITSKSATWFYCSIISQPISFLQIS